MKKPIRVFYSELSGRFYATAHYKEHIHPDSKFSHVTVTGEKFDVTNDIARAIKHYDIEFTVVQ
jgi:hypothetical protein